MCAQLLAGAAKVVITPPVGLDLCGFGARPGPSEAVHDDLCAAALYLEADQPALIITCDLIGLDRASVAEVRAGIEAQTGIPAGHIMLGCSHTHSGPATPCIVSLGKTDPDYLAVLKRKLIGLGRMAYDGRQPCALGTLREPVSVAINRREVGRDGNMRIGRNERGLTAPWVDVVAVDTMAGKPLARYFVHAAHAVTLSGQDITADWPGYAQRIVERIYGDGCVALFGQGCCGNLNSEPRGTYEIAEAQGRAMAGAVVKAAEYAAKEPEVTIACASVDLALPCFDPPTVAEAEAQVAAFKQTAAGPDRNYGMSMMDAGDIAWAERILALAQAGATGLTRAYEVQALRLGDFLLVGLPGEVFVEYALQIDEGAPYGQTATMAYANDNVGYVPTAQAHTEGGYEVQHAIRFYGDTMLRPESERMIVEAALELARRLR
jgi:neutral ceramidase